MSQSNAEMAAGVEKFKLTAGAEKDDGAMKVDAQHGSEVEICPHENVGRGSEIVEEVAEFETDGRMEMEDIVETLKVEISALTETSLKQEAELEAKQACHQTLEQQLAVMETENATKVSDAEKQSEEHIFNSDPVKMALEIPLILEIILGKLDFSSLMSSRTVAKYWNEAAMTIFSKTPPNGNRTRRLNLEKFFASSNINSFKKLEPKLTKRIYFRGICIGEDPLNRDVCICNSLKQKLLVFFQEFSTQIHVMDLQMPALFAPTFLKAITNACPNLKALYLEICHDCEENSQDIELFEMESMPQEQLFRMKLNTIEFKNGSMLDSSCFHIPLQRLIDHAPNLTRLKIEANFYPNLVNNKLKFLYFDGKVNKPNFSQMQLSQMLDQVKDSLIVLKIKTVTFFVDLDSPSFQGFSLPHMKILKHLLIWDVFLHPLEEDGRTLFQTISSKFPNLEHLDMRNPDPEEKGVELMLNKVLQGRAMQLFKIHTLVVDRVQNLSVLGLISRWFPNLKNLRLTMPDNGEIEAVFYSLRELKLKYFIFSMEFCFNFSDLVTALVANQELFKGLENLDICALLDMMDDLGALTRQNFCDWLRSTTKNMKSVTFKDFMFTGASALEVMPVIREQRLPIHFINN